jgi:hypothetical protein
MLGLLSNSGCSQRPITSQQKNATGAAGAPAKGMTASKSQKPTTDSGTEENAGGAMAKGGSAGKSTGTNANNANAAGASAPGSAATGSARAAAAGSGAPAAANPKAIPECDGKDDEHVCDSEGTLYHCVDGAYEGRPQTCMTAAQCAAGLTTGQCGECDPGSFQCLDIELQRCDDTGTWVLEMECASAKLCKADMGICDVQVCHEGEYKCTGDQLQTCNADFSDFVDEGPACEPGLCSAEAKGCLECMPGTPAACSDERTVMTCTPEGKQAPQPCATATPFCAKGACVQCNTDTDCGEPMNDCGTLTCNAGMCVAGSPKPKGTACSSNGGKMCDYLGSCVFCVTDLDCNDSTKRCFLQRDCVTKDAIIATPLLSTWSVTISPGFRASVSAPAGVTVTGAPLNTLDGSQARDVTHLISIPMYSASGFPQVAQGEGSRIQLGFAPSDPSMCTMCASIQVVLEAEKL